MAHLFTKSQIHGNTIKGFLCLLFCCFALNLFAQQDYTTKSKKAAKFFDNALEYLDQQAANQGKRELKKAIDADRNFIEAYLVLGEVCFDRKEDEEAIEAFEQAVRLNAKFHVGAWSFLGDLYFRNEDYTLARNRYTTYLELFRSKDSTVYRSVKKKLLQIDFIEECLKNLKPFAPHNLGQNINSTHDEYLPALTADEQTLVITVRRPVDEMSQVTTPFEEDFYIAYWENGEWTKARPMPEPINTHGNEGAQSISPDGRFIYFSRCNTLDGFGSCDLYVSEKRGNKWSVPQNLGGTVNSSAWESQPSISSDGRTLYFVSNRPGGLGKSDIWKTTKDLDGNWTAPVNLGPTVNTEENEMSPFIHQNNSRLYFASAGHVGMGGLDLFFSDFDEDSNTWKEPVNMGCPINTPADEMNLIVSASGLFAMFSSDRLEGLGKQDIYRFDLPENERPIPATYIKGKVFDKHTNKSLAAIFELIDLREGKTMLSSASDPETGEFLLCIPADRNYALHVQAQGYLFYSEHFETEATSAGQPFLKNIALSPIAVGESIVLNNVFFETGEAKLKNTSRVELNRVVEMLKKNPSLGIEITGHTDNVGQIAFNQTLSENRAKSVYDFLLDKGVDKTRLRYKGYGETKPIASNETEQGRAKNRRTEFEIYIP